MKLSKRRVELVPKVLAACEELIGQGQYPTGPSIRSACQGVSVLTARVVRDYLIRQGSISVVQFWPDWTDETVYTVGSAAEQWPEWTDEYLYGLGAGNRNWPAKSKRRDARRAAVEVTP